METIMQRIRRWFAPSPKPDTAAEAERIVDDALERRRKRRSAKKPSPSPSSLTVPAGR